MSLDNIKTAGPNNVPSYQMSGVPYMTSSGGDPLTTAVRKITFPYVTRFVIIQNLSTGSMRLGFSSEGIASSGGSTKNYFVISGTQMTPRIEVRCKELYLRSDSAVGTVEWSMIAGLTTIHHGQFPVLTGSVNGTSSFLGV